jgi:hypothetical protein
MRRIQKFQSKTDCEVLVHCFVIFHGVSGGSDFFFFFSLFFLFFFFFLVNSVRLALIRIFALLIA